MLKLLKHKNNILDIQIHYFSGQTKYKNFFKLFTMEIWTYKVSKGQHRYAEI